LCLLNEVEESRDEKKTEKTTEGDDEDDSDSDSGSTEGEDLITAMAAVKVEESPWQNAPSYPPLYLSTVTEYLPPQPKPRLPKGVTVEDLGDEDKKDKDISWAKETYEDSLDVDEVFERFMKRAGYESEQCVRLVFYTTLLKADAHYMD